MMELDWLAILIGAVLGAVVVGALWLWDMVKTGFDDSEDRFGPY